MVCLEADRDCLSGLSLYWLNTTCGKEEKDLFIIYPASPLGQNISNFHLSFFLFFFLPFLHKSKVKSGKITGLHIFMHHIQVQSHHIWVCYSHSALGEQSTCVGNRVHLGDWVHVWTKNTKYIQALLHACTAHSIRNQSLLPITWAWRTSFSHATRFYPFLLTCIFIFLSRLFVTQAWPVWESSGRAGAYGPILDHFVATWSVRCVCVWEHGYAISYERFPPPPFVQYGTKVQTLLFQLYTS